MNCSDPVSGSTRKSANMYYSFHLLVCNQFKLGSDAAAAAVPDAGLAVPLAETEAGLWAGVSTGIFLVKQPESEQV